MNNTATLPDSLVAQLRAYESRLKRMETTAAIAGGVAGLFITYVLLFVADRFVNTPVAARMALAGTGAVLAAIFAQSWARYWLWTRRGPAQLAKLLQGHFRGLGDRLQGVIELTESKELPENISPALLRAAVRQVAEESGRCNFEDAVPVRPVRRWVLTATVVTGLAAAPFLVAPKAATNAAQRWAMPWAEIERYTFTTVEELPKDLFVAHGEKFVLSVGLRADAEWKPGSATARIEGQEKLTAQFAEGRANFEFPSQTKDGVISVRVGDFMKDIALHPLHRPELKELAAKVALPPYLGYPEQSFKLQGSAGEFLEGSRVSFEGTIARGVGSGEVRSADFTWLASVEGNSFRTPLISLPDLGGEVRFSWKDVHGLAPVQPYGLRIGQSKDAEPRIEVQNMETELAILPYEAVQFTMAASDDFGLKETWVSWEMRKAGEKADGDKKKEKPKSAFESLWEDWKKGAAKDAVTVAKPKLETPRVAGGPMVKEMLRPVRWAPSEWGIPEDSVVELTANALDFYPDRKPVQSWKYTVFVLSAEKHAERIRERMDNVLKQLDERIRDEERQMEESKEIAERKDADSEKAGEDIKRAEAGEKQNAEELKNLVAQMQDVMKDALRNKEIQADTMKEYSEIARKLDEEANEAQKKAAASLANAAGAPKEQRAQEMKDAMAQQQKALDAMREAAGKMQTTNETLLARNFYNRLRHAATQQFKISDGLKELAKSTVGLKPDEIEDTHKKKFDGVAGNQDGAVKDVDAIQNDMGAFLRRIPNEKYEVVVKEMEDTKVVSELGELAGFVRANLGLKSVGKAKQWGEQLNKWADSIQSECNCKGGESETDPDQMELMIAMVRAAVAQDTIRDQTIELEKAKAAENYASEAAKLSAVQSGLAGSVKKLAEEPKFAKFMDKVGPVLEKAEELMTETAGELKSPRTDDNTTQIQGTTIEILVPPDKKGGKPNPAMAKMQKQMQQMMQQMSKGKKPGRNASQNASSLAGTAADGASGKNKANARVVDKSGGSASAGEWPEEFRDALQSYIQAVEDKN
jgi:hypothetical protein